MPWPTTLIFHLFFPREHRRKGGPEHLCRGRGVQSGRRWTRLSAPPGGLTLPKANVGPLTRIMVAPDGRVVFLADNARSITLLDADRAAWSTVAADELGKRNGFRALLAGPRLLVWGGLTVVAEHLCRRPYRGGRFAIPSPRRRRTTTAG